ncbi:MAG TPA: CBS domain-containing protein [Polyangiaceae bacterium]|jgi:CBS domain-containing protein|nr:CBS domain-containing protein [Polyangiaceae bacterium]
MSVKRLTAAQLMTEGPIMIEPSESLRSAARLMTEKHLHCLLVPSEPGRVVGVITSKDIIQVLCEGEPEMLDQLRVSDAMTAPALCVPEELLIDDCLRLMRMSGVRSVPVVRGLTPVGILSFTDVLRAVSS